jgi:hypothetical protein
MSEPDPIEVKVNIKGNVDDALTGLQLDEGEPREVWFVEDLTDGVELPLLSAGVILRLRRRTKKNNKTKEDSTVKLRPCRRSQLISPWDVMPAPEADYRVEGDRSRKRQVIAASYQADLQPGTIERVLEGGGHIRDVFTEPQRAFLSGCAAIQVAFSGVSALKPIASTTWKDFSVGDVENVAAERWTVAGMDFLELSLRVTTGRSDAEALQRALMDTVVARGLELDDNEEPKTTRVMKHLAGLD